LPVLKALPSVGGGAVGLNQVTDDNGTVGGGIKNVAG
jgi:hypothetical protein